MKKIFIAIFIILEMFNSIAFAAPKADYTMTTSDFYNECFGREYERIALQDRMKAINEKYNGKTVILFGRILSKFEFANEISFVLGREDFKINDIVRKGEVRITKDLHFYLDSNDRLQNIKPGDYIAVYCKNVEAGLEIFDNNKYAVNPDSNWKDLELDAYVRLEKAKIIEHKKKEDMPGNNIKGDFYSFVNKYYGYQTIRNLKDELNVIPDSIINNTRKRAEISGKVIEKRINAFGDIEFKIGEILNEGFSKEVDVEMKNFNEAKNLYDGELVKIKGDIEFPRITVLITEKGNYFGTSIYIRNAELAK